jgi:alkanesulfonate monooxygenase SsuD/methylene tetrahydromethanopterin reductase-like flavin-dependent oxidoreductase (luciferase family)
VVRASHCEGDPITDSIDFGIYLPQLAMSFEGILERAQRCEDLGYDSFWLFDHLYGPGLPDLPSFEGWTLATALLARTTRLRVGHLVNCNNFRHPALLAKMATTLDVISGGRVELGLGSGSVEEEHHQAGLPWGSIGERSERLGEALEIITSMFASPRTTFAGNHYAVRDLPNLPPPVQPGGPPIHVGGAGPLRTLPLVARYANAWNVPTYALDRIAELQRALDDECERIGRDPGEIRRSIEAVLVITTDDQLESAKDVANRRYGGPGFGLAEGGFVGTPEQVTDRIGELAAAGFSSFIFMTHDRASAETLELFAHDVMIHFREGPATTQEGA